MKKNNQFVEKIINLIDANDIAKMSLFDWPHRDEWLFLKSIIDSSGEKSDSGFSGAISLSLISLLRRAELDGVVSFDPVKWAKINQDYRQMLSDALADAKLESVHSMFDRSIMQSADSDGNYIDYDHYSCFDQIKEALKRSISHRVTSYLLTRLKPYHSDLRWSSQGALTRINALLDSNFLGGTIGIGHYSADIVDMSSGKSSICWVNPVSGAVISPDIEIPSSCESRFEVHIDINGETMHLPCVNLDGGVMLSEDSVHIARGALDASSHNFCG